MMNTWKGLHNSPEHGLQVLVETLSTLPKILSPQKLLSGIGSRPILALALRYLEPKSPVLGEIN
jgi:hypothetical protein